MLKTHTNISLTKTKGYETFQHRTDRDLKKIKSKLDYKWEAHNVDSHCLCEIILRKEIKPYYGMYKLEFLKYYRRQLHVQNPIKGNIRKQYGGTVSLGLSRGSIVKHKNDLVYIGGSSKGRLTIHSIITGKRLARNIKKESVKVLYNTKFIVQFLPSIFK